MEIAKKLEKIWVVNGIERKLIVDPDAFLSEVLREQMHLVGTKVGCGKGQCGACSVILDGKVVRACITKVRRIDNFANITTIEGLGTPQNLHPLQVAWVVNGAAQCGFCTPGFIMSAKGLLDENPKPTREQVRDWFQKHKNVCRCTGFIPLVDSVMDAAKVLRGEMTLDINHNFPADGNIFNSRAPRPSGVAKVTGQWAFGDDQKLQLPADTLHLAIVEARVSHANIKGIDYSEALKMPGVHSIITAKDVKGKNRITGLITFPTNKGDGWDRPILCDTKVFQYGDAIALVAADSEKNARAAAEKVKVDLEVLPAYMNAPAAMAEDAIEIHPGTPNTYYKQGLVKGDDPEPFFSSPDCVVAEGSYYTQRQPHLPIEPDVGYAMYDEDGILRIYSKSIGLYLHLYMIAPGLGVEPDKIALIQLPTGGTFGYKFSPTMEALVGAATMATGRPCHLHYNYAQQQYYTGKRSPFWTTGKVAADKKTGKIKGTQHEWICDHGPYSEFGDLLTLRGAQYFMAGYGIPNMRAVGYCVCTNHGWGSAFRGYGSPEIMFPSEVLMDELALKGGWDPLELRYANCYRPGDTTPTGQVPDSFMYPEMIDILRPKYKEALANAKRHSTDTLKKGVGVAFGIYGSGLDGADSAGSDVELNADGTITIFNTWQDHGQGSDLSTLCVAHEALKPLGIPASKLKIFLNDTSKCPNSGPAGGSRSNVLVGNAIINGCQQLLDGMRKPDGTFRTYDEMVKEGIKTKYNGTWTQPATDCDPDTGQGNPFACYMYGLFMAEVTVDTTTGKTQVDKMTLVEDVGTLTNRQTVDGQNWGGLAQGIGLALTEDFEDIKKHSSLAGAGVPYIKDVPDVMELIYVDSPREHGPFGASGVGEVPLCGPHPAIINAIANATGGAFVRHLPAYPEKVLAAIKELGK